MNRPAEPTPYRTDAARSDRRRTLLIVAAVILVVAVGLTLHLAGILPPD